MTPAPDRSDQSSPEERLAEARRRLYMPDVSEADRAEVVRLEAALVEGPEPTGAGTDDDESDPPPLPAHRRVRRVASIGLGVLAIALLTVVALQVTAQSRAVQQHERATRTSAAALGSITLPQLLTRFSSSLPSEWQGAAIVATHDRVRSAVGLPIATDSGARHHFLVVRCPDADGRWLARATSAGRTAAGWGSVSGSCGGLGFAPLPVGADAVRVEVEGGLPFSVAVLAHS